MYRGHVLVIVATAILALAVGQLQAETVTVPNGEFFTYKPGTDYTVTATFPSGNYTSGVGDDLAVKGNGVVEYSDGTSGGSVDCPGWIGLTGNNDLLNNGVDGSVGYNAFGTWSGGTGTTAESAEPLGNIGLGRVYTLSAMVNGSGGPLVLDLLADGEPIAPTSSVTPSLPTDGWQVISMTYDTTTLAGYLGQAMTIVLGTGAEDLVGTRVVFDNVSLSYEILFQFEAYDPVPADVGTDVWRDTPLSWTAGQYAVAHDVYLGTRFEDVNDATTASAVYMGRQDQTTFEPGRLEFGATYYWRVDEVNAPPNSAIHRGEIWSFTVEPIAYPIENVTATSNTTSAEDVGPENTVNGSGLDENDRHSTDTTDMWAGTPVAGEPPYIQFEFDGLYKLHEMLVWNYNMGFEAFLGMGVRDATVEYSQDGIDWAVLGDVVLKQAPGTEAYAANTTVPLEGVAARYVRLNIHSSWISTSMHALSEVRFMYVPVEARKPEPGDGAADVTPDTVLSWRPGREAAQHDVYLSPDEQTVIDGEALAATVPQASYAPALDLGRTYYWRIVEVNEAETPSLWSGDVWSFSTQESIGVDDFERYTDDMAAGEAIFQTWVDAVDDASKGGSVVGYDAAPNGTFGETTVVHGGGQSMPLTYDNTSATYSETTRTFDVAQDWTPYGIKVLNLWIHGDPNNDAQQMYVKIDNTKILYTGDAEMVKRPLWQVWPIDLSAYDVSNVYSLTIGLERLGGVGGQGLVFIDDIELRGAPPEVEAISLIESFDSLAVGANMHDVDGWEGWYRDAQWGARVTDVVAYSGANSLEIVGQRDDLVPNWPAQSSGQWTLKVMQYCPSNVAAAGKMYFGALSEYDGAAEQVGWVGSLIADFATGKAYCEEDPAVQVDLIYDAWAELRVEIDLYSQVAHFYYNDVYLATRPATSIAGVDIWPTAEIEAVYFDDFSFEQAQ